MLTQGCHLAETQGNVCPSQPLIFRTVSTIADHTQKEILEIAQKGKFTCHV